ncbi:MAG: YDG domain-containing protein [Pseudomonadota bacterium]|nr:YDG domain-containing protein [Pseudomonadota bacterium]
MNHIYRSIWNESTGTTVAVSENTKRCGKRASGGRSAVVRSGFILKSLAVSVALSHGAPGYASPEGGTVVAGNASISSAPGNTTIHQTSQNVALNWQSFDIGIGEAVRFVQPDSNSVALNRVLGADPSSILGSLSANGKVFLVNPNGILFGTGAQVNVGGLVASTRDISDGDFLAGRYTFSGGSTAGIVNQGSINADGGYVALLGANVSNQGVVAAKLGTVALAAGNVLTLDVAGDGLLNVTVNAGAVGALVQNGGLIQANGGQVLLTAQAAGNLLQTAVNNSGSIQAQTIENRNGTIRLLGDMQSGSVNLAGTLDASAPAGGAGGFVETSAAHVQFTASAVVTTHAAVGASGEWLIDPFDFTIAASGGDITGALLSTNLGLGNITIVSGSGASGVNGDINVNDTVSWSANRLTLSAFRNININTAMHGSGTGSLALEYGQGAVAAGNTATVDVHAPVNLAAGNNFSTRLGSDGSVVNYTVITSLGSAGSMTGTDLQGMNGNVHGNYVLGSDLDATATSSWNGGAGFAPITQSVATIVDYGEGPFEEIELTPFSGRFDGLGHTISHLTIDRTSSANVGLFGITQAGSVIRNVGLIDSSVSGSMNVGALVGDNSAVISNSYASGSVTGSAQDVGGLVGNNTAAISNSYASGSVSGTAEHVGGLVGRNTAAISNSHSSSSVQGSNWIGGLLGYSTGTLSNSYATGDVSGVQLVGGLVGNNQGPVSNSYATGDVSGTTYVGGLLGFNSSPLSFSYASGSAVGSTNTGGLIGSRNGMDTITSSYWNSSVNAGGIGMGASTGATGLTSLQMQTAANFAGFNFTTNAGAAGNNWVMIDVDGSLNNAGGELGATRPMLASEYSTTVTNAHQLQLMAMDVAASYTLGRNIDAAATGTTADIWLSSFIPVGIAPDMMMMMGAPFAGSFDGRGRTIDNLVIARPGQDNVGLFSYLDSDGSVTNVGLAGGSVSGSQYVGALVGVNRGTVSNSFATTAVTGSGNRVGGLIGDNQQQGSISNSYATGAVSGAAVIGGLVGGSNGSGYISNSFATGAVTGTEYLGGLIGVMEGGSINDSYATGAVTGSGENVGGLAGYTFATHITNTYATGAVAGLIYVGGLIGFRNEGGAGPSVVQNSYWNSDVVAAGVGGGGLVTGTAGLTTLQMNSAASFGSWDFATTWFSYDGSTRPLLRSFMTPLTITATATKTYDGQAYSGTPDVTYSVTPELSSLFGTLAVNHSGATNAGTSAITAGGLYSDQFGYLITYTPGALTINPYAVNLTGSRAYDGTDALTASSLSIGTLVNGETLTLTGSGSVASKNVGTGKTVTLGTLALGNGTGLASNYTFTGGTQTAQITRAVLTGTVLAPDKIYDGNTAADFTVSALTGLVGTETVVVSGVAAFNSKDVADANLVTVNGITLSDGANGALASNYSFSTSATATARITARQLTVAGQTAVNKVYDGTTTATLIGGSLIGVVAGETVTLNQAGAFVSAAPGSGIAVTAADSLGGIAAANYTLAQPTGLAADITALPLENPPENMPVDVTAVETYRGAVAYVSSNIPAALARSSSLSAPASAPVSVSSPAAVVSYDLSGLNLTIIASDAGLPANLPSQDTEDKK